MLKKKYNYGLLMFGVIFFLFGCHSEETNKAKSLIPNDEESTIATEPSSTLPETNTPNTGTSEEVNLSANGSNHPLFSIPLGAKVSSARLGAISNDPTGLTIIDDWDGDGIPNSHEISSNQYVADYPRIVSRIALPITLEIRVDETNSSLNFAESIQDSDVKHTIDNSMESRHYTQFNLKTTPYVVKESYSESGKHSESYGYKHSESKSESTDSRRSASGSYKMASGKVSGRDIKSKSKSSSTEVNTSMSNEFARSSFSERTVFDNIGYVDNLDRNGIEYTEDTIQRVAKNYRSSDLFTNATSITPDAGLVRASLYLRNTSVNIPVKVSNVLVTLSFLTPTGTVLPIKTFNLKDSDGNPFVQDIMGGDEFGPYTIEINNLNTVEVKKALAGGYIPQIHIVSYDLTKVQNSNYNPGLDYNANSNTEAITNLKVVEEVAKGRTATIYVRAKGLSETYRVTAFDKIDDNYSPGISLKKALFQIYKNPITEEHWDDSTLLSLDNANSNNTEKLHWRVADETEYNFSETVTGNSWKNFETYVKSYVDEFNQVQKLETIKRIGNYQKFNPFNVNDDPNFKSHERLSEEQFRKMKYWIILHNGEYFKGDINDPIWVGDRYEIIFFDAADFHDHFQSVVYTPLQSNEPFTINTRWNRLNNNDEFSRAIKLGRILENDAIELEVELEETRLLFDQSVSVHGMGIPTAFPAEDASVWFNFNYTFDSPDPLPEGIPTSFEYTVTGGPNSFDVVIPEPSQNALRYEILYCSGNACDPYTSNNPIVVTPEQLEKENGAIYVMSQTVRSDLSPVGVLFGDYRVAIRAIGQKSNNEVYTNSISGITSFTVFNPALAPSEFAYALAGSLNELDVKIQASVDAEYYEITIYGPDDFNSSSQVLIGHVGLNTISIENPSGSFSESGLYKVDVLAKNSVGDMSGSIESPFIEIEYDKFAGQKLYAPKRNTERSFIGAVDLEINFDDGMGWRRLLLSSEDNPMGNSLVLANSSFTEHKEQKFHINFNPPENVFENGRKYADVYIRTVPETKYRDSFWMKPTLDEEGNTIDLIYSPSLERSIYFQGAWSTTKGKNVIKEWTQTALHDASRVEEALSCSGQDVPSYDNTGNNWVNDKSCDISKFRLINGGTNTVSLNDFFFSPLEERVYKLSAHLTNQVALSGSQQPEKPNFQISTPIFGQILVDNFSSSGATHFKVYWRAGRIEMIDYSESLESGGWFNSGTTGITSNDSFDFAVESDTYYSVIVVAENSNTGEKSQWSEPKEIFLKESVFQSCQSILDYHPTAQDGLYTIQLSSGPALSAYCDMTTDGGGWTLVARAVANDGNAKETRNAVGTTPVLPNHSTTAKLSDSDINMIVSENIYRISLDNGGQTMFYLREAEFDATTISGVLSCKDNYTDNWSAQYTGPTAPNYGSYGPLTMRKSDGNFMCSAGNASWDIGNNGNTGMDDNKPGTLWVR